MCPQAAAVHRQCWECAHPSRSQKPLHSTDEAPAALSGTVACPRPPSGLAAAERTCGWGSWPHSSRRNTGSRVGCESDPGNTWPDGWSVATPGPGPVRPLPLLPSRRPRCSSSVRGRGAERSPGACLFGSWASPGADSVHAARQKETHVLQCDHTLTTGRELQRGAWVTTAAATPVPPLLHPPPAGACLAPGTPGCPGGAGPEGLRSRTGREHGPRGPLLPTPAPHLPLRKPLSPASPTRGVSGGLRAVRGQ